MVYVLDSHQKIMICFSNPIGVCSLLVLYHGVSEGKRPLGHLAAHELFWRLHALTRMWRLPAAWFELYAQYRPPCSPPTPDPREQEPEYLPSTTYEYVYQHNIDCTLLTIARTGQVMFHMPRRGTI